MDAAKQIFEQFVHPLVGEEKIKQWVKGLRTSPWPNKYLTLKRLLTPAVIQRFHIGWDGVRLTLPIYNEFGLCVNTKLYDPLAEKHGTYKMVNYRADDEKRSFGRPIMLYPIEMMGTAADKGYVVLCEGEWDALVMISLGIPAITMSGGSKSWAEQYNELFRGLKVIVAYDNDKDGTKYDKLALTHLSLLAKSIRRLQIPKKVRNHAVKDVTDWARASGEMRQKKGWLGVFKTAKLLLKNDDATITQQSAVEVGLDQASLAQYGGKRIRVNALVTGKAIAPYLLPERYRITCAKTCEGCPLAEAQKEYKTVELDPKNPNILQLVDITHNQLRHELFRRGGMSPGKECHANIDVVKHMNLEGIVVIPTLENQASQYVTRSCYFNGHGLHTNRAYQFEGVTVPDPQTQQATHLFDSAKPVQGEIESFKLTPELHERLKSFRPKSGKILAHLMSIAEWQARHVTKIRERPDLHIAVDLVYHSVEGFEFNGELVSRGMLDVLVIGDTRCGKGYVGEGLTRFYGIGQVASGENCSFAGLVGGVQQIGSRWMVTWGLIPLNHGRLVLIDEASSLSIADFGKMSRVRSEGIAEISKIVRETTQANTRLIWLGNPRSGRPIMSYNTGVDAVKELMGSNEDISRFDFVISVATNEVPSEVINAVEPMDVSDHEKYPRDLCRNLVLWAWSRTASKVRFTKDAVTRIIRSAVDLSEKYSATVPLIQGENVRIKLAKIAAAVAARCYSTDETGEFLVVEESHVVATVEFVNMVYSKPSLAYDTYSRTKDAITILDPTTQSLAPVFKGLGADEAPTVEGLLRLTRISGDSLGDYTGDIHLAKDFIGTLVRNGCLLRIESGNFYVKTPEFTNYLRTIAEAHEWSALRQRHQKKGQNNVGVNGKNGSHVPGRSAHRHLP